MQLTSFIIQKTLWKPNNHSLSFVLMRVIEWLMWMACSGETSVCGEWMTSPMCSWCSRYEAELRRNPPQRAEWDRETCLSPLHCLEVFVFLHQLSSQSTIYLPWTVLTFSSFHLWQISDTLGQSLTRSQIQYHTHNCQYKKEASTWPDTLDWPPPIQPHKSQQQQTGGRRLWQM